MKTLDEVISAYELCSEGKCEECLYRQIATNLGYVPCDPTERDADALHYLKAHKNQQDFYDDGIKRTTEMIDKCEKTVAEYLAVNNPPLTWEELKQMEGKPVWVEWISGTWKGLHKWVISHGCDDLTMVFTALDVARVSYDGRLREISLGKTWQAYRKERS